MTVRKRVRESTHSVPPPLQAVGAFILDIGVADMAPGSLRLSSLGAATEQLGPSPLLALGPSVWAALTTKPRSLSAGTGRRLPAPSRRDGRLSRYALSQNSSYRESPGSCPHASLLSEFLGSRPRSQIRRPHRQPQARPAQSIFRASSYSELSNCPHRASADATPNLWSNSNVFAIVRQHRDTAMHFWDYS